MTRATVTLAAGLALTLIAIGVTLSSSPLVVAQTNGTPAGESIVEATNYAEACQADEVLPAGISAIRLTLVSAVGPRVSVTALAGTHVLTSGVAGSGWTSGAVTVPVRPLARAVSHVRICFGLGPTVENVLIGGSKTSPAVAARSEGKPLPGRITIEYMRAGRSSWWSLASTVARHIGLGRAPSGTWIALLMLALMGAAVATASWLVVRELR
jgi:hypothetical protein